MQRVSEMANYPANRRIAHAMYIGISRYSLSVLEKAGFQLRYFRSSPEAEILLFWRKDGDNVCAFYCEGLTDLSDGYLAPRKWPYQEPVMDGFDAAIEQAKKWLRFDDIGLHHLRDALFGLKRERARQEKEDYALWPWADHRMPESFSIMNYTKKELLEKIN